MTSLLLSYYLLVIILYFTYFSHIQRQNINNKTVALMQLITTALYGLSTVLQMMLYFVLLVVISLHLVTKIMKIFLQKLVLNSGKK